MKACTVDKCKQTYYSKGYCKQHYDRVRRRGTTANRVMDKDLPCVAGNCNKPVHAKKLCAAHYALLRKWGVPKSPMVYSADPKAKAKARVAKWKKDNWEYYRAYLNARKKRVKQATPKWVKLADLTAIYTKCPKGHHVDHIIPITHQEVCGLHVPWNLRIVTAAENLAKNNEFKT